MTDLLLRVLPLSQQRRLPKYLWHQLIRGGCRVRGECEYSE